VGAVSGSGSDARSSEGILVLASASPQRRAILEQLGVAFTVVPADVEELAGGEPGGLVRHNALLKARAVPGELVLGADTAVAVDGDVLGKPAGRGQARGFLERLAGREHAVWSGVALVQGAEERVAVDHARVRFRTLSPGQIEAYLDSGEWEGRAGGYAIQGRGAALVEGIEGDYNCVVGLPVSALTGLAPELILGS
jgi:septum formation protein